MIQHYFFLYFYLSLAPLRSANSVKCPILTVEQQKKCNEKNRNHEIECCPDKKTIFLFGPTRSGKTFWAKLLLDYSEGIPTDFFNDSADPLSSTSAIRCKCGAKFRVCDSPGIPDNCGMADEYLNSIISFWKNQKPSLLLLVLVLDVTKSLGELQEESYYKAFKLCVGDFSLSLTFIIRNKVTSLETKYLENLEYYDEKIKPALQINILISIELRRHISCFSNNNIHSSRNCYCSSQSWVTEAWSAIHI